MYDVKLISTLALAPNITTFTFERPQGFHYVAGQFIEVHLAHAAADNRGEKRWFTLSSSPSEPHLSITTKFAEKSSTFKTALRALTVGATLKITDAMGDFVLPKNTQIPLLFVAGGIGITPVRSMLQWLADSSEERDVTVVYGVRNESELVFNELLSGSAIRFEPHVSQPKNWQGQTGVINSPTVMHYVRPDHLIFTSGPEDMIEMLVHDLKLAGIDGQRIVTDYFPGYPDQLR
jgi:glycine betaine catabolism B